MKRTRGSTQKFRTVTEIINGDEKLQKTYDLADFNAKNLNSLESYDLLKIKMTLAKYMAMLHNLSLTQPLLTIFRNKGSSNDGREIIIVVWATLSYIHSRANFLVNSFDNSIEYVIVEDQNYTIPGEPIVFKKTENDGILCMIDRKSILKTLERQFDMEMNADYMLQEKSKLKLIRTFTSSGRKERYDCNPGEENYITNESVVTQYLTLMLMHEHAYMHYCNLINFGVTGYTDSILDHNIFSNKCKPSINLNFCNLLLSKVNFSVECCDGSGTGSVKSIVKNINVLNYK
ncbi:occlusion-derived virus envelope protein E27 [Malacosoma neustria nucleopolyhedrovirus]|uniref:occlusion-derived virus envelope protein E27 n=1 Tax=Malacosoma neustria nuclear polyhedrosis virus TaxID=38012 RepID=UPI000E360300|nr:occlusion-derived virus envelope protein E27 [Malacosoma neustria nucleopolyhedrovirus]AUF81541.1 occlusion-derived virus envelope protein E27 [Malacosoma neustria nucleopolyhedrovirus]